MSVQFYREEAHTLVRDGERIFLGKGDVGYIRAGRVHDADYIEACRLVYVHNGAFAFRLRRGPGHLSGGFPRGRGRPSGAEAQAPARGPRGALRALWDSHRGGPGGEVALTRRRLAHRRTRRAVPRLYRSSSPLRLGRRRSCRLGHRLADQPGHRRVGGGRRSRADDRGAGWERRLSDSLRSCWPSFSPSPPGRRGEEVASCPAARRGGPLCGR